MTTNGPPDDPADTTVLACFDAELDAWAFSVTEAGPAGNDVVHLDAVRVSVDTAAPDRLVEVLVRCGDSGPADPATIELVGKLLGSAAARIVACLPRPGPPVHLAIRGDRAVVATASALAVAVTAMGTTRLRPARWLRGLDIVLQATRMGAEASALAVGAAWEIWPYVVSFARTAGEAPGLLGAPRPALAALRSRLLVLLHVVTNDDATIAETTAHRTVHRLAVVLGVGLGKDGSSTRAAVTEPGVTILPSGRSRARDVLVFKGAEIRWLGAVEDFVDRLGPASRLLRRGVVDVHGRAPGDVTVSVPIMTGVTTDELSEIRVRLLTPDALPVEEAVLVAGRATDEMPTAYAHVTLPGVVGDRRLHAVAVDLARTEVPVPDAAELAHLARVAGVREGRQAVAATAARQIDAALGHWEECARQFEVAGDDARAERARDYASRAAACVGSLLGPHEEWLYDVADAAVRWSRASLAEIEDIADLDRRVAALRAFVDRLAAWSDPSVELATARAALGRTLRRHAGLADDPEESARQLTEAGRLFSDTGHLDEALACQRELGRRRPRR